MLNINVGVNGRYAPSVAGETPVPPACAALRGTSRKDRGGGVSFLTLSCILRLTPHNNINDFHLHQVG